MKTLLKILAFLAALALPVAIVSAQGYGAQGYGGGMMQGGNGMGGQMRRYMPSPDSLPALKEKLAITPQQEGPWKTYSDAVGNLWDLRQSMQAAAPGPNASIEERQQIRDAHRQAMTSARSDMTQARDGLAAALSPEQRQTLDREAPPMPAGMPGW